MGNKNTAIRFLRDKGFYIALAVCIVGAAGAAWAAPAVHLLGLKAAQETEEGLLALGGALVHPGVLQHLGEHCPNLLLQDAGGVVPGEGVSSPQFLRPIGVLAERLIGPEVSTLGQGVRQKRQLSLEAGGSTAKPMTSMRPIFSF